MHYKVYNIIHKNEKISFKCWRAFELSLTLIWGVRLYNWQFVDPDKQVLVVVVRCWTFTWPDQIIISIHIGIRL